MIARRALLGGAGALLAGWPLAGQARGRRKPPRLRAGDTVGLVAPASALTPGESLAGAEHWIRGMGLVPRAGAHAEDRAGYLAGTDADRAADITAMFADADIRAIFAVRGGWGGARLLDYIDWRVVRANPKLLIGFSDTTALHLAIAARAGFASLHAPNASGRWEGAAWDSLWQLAFAGTTPVLGGAAAEAASGRPARTLVPGRAEGRLLGGNLTVLSTLMGTGWLPRLDGAVLFLEDVGEAVYRIDRMLQQLALAGVLRRAEGIVFGQCTRCTEEDGTTPGYDLDAVLDHHLGGLGVPCFVGGNFGHVRGQMCLPSGLPVTLDAAARTITPREPLVA